MLGQRVKALSLGALAGIVLVSLMGPSGGLPTRPKFSAVGIGTSAPTTGQLDVSNATDARVFLSESGATANNRKWGFRATGEQLHFQATNDALGSASWLTVDRTGTSVDSITLGSEYLYSGGASSARLYLQTTGAASSEKIWGLAGLNDGRLLIGAASDAGSFDAVGVALDRTGTTIDSLALTATQVTVNGVAVPRVAYFYIDGTTGAASRSVGVSSASRSAAGRYTINFTGGFFTAAPICTFSAYADVSYSATQSISEGAATASVFYVRTFANSTPGTTADVSFQGQCIGPG